jgi:hypothetical protein
MPLPVRSACLQQVPPGSSSSRVLLVHNPTDLPFPFSWTAQPLERDSRSSSTQDCEQPAGFAVSPARGVLEPGQALEFTVTFTPPCVAQHSALLVLSVQRSGDAGLCSISEWAASVSVDLSSTAAQRSTLAGGNNSSSSSGQHSTTLGVSQAAHPAASSWSSVLSVAVEGLGQAIALRVEPAANLALPGSLTVGDTAEQDLLLVNPTAAPAHITIQPEAAGNAAGRSSNAAAVAEVTPAAAVIPALGSLPLRVRFTALAAGVHRQGFVVGVRNGLAIQLHTRVAVHQVRVGPAAPTLDFGVLCLGSSASLALQLANTATRACSHWHLQQLGLEVRPEGAVGVSMACSQPGWEASP